MLVKHAATDTGKQLPTNICSPFPHNSYVDLAANTGPFYCLGHIYLQYIAGMHCDISCSPGLLSPYQVSWSAQLPSNSCPSILREKSQTQRDTWSRMKPGTLWEKSCRVAPGDCTCHRIEAQP